MKKLTAFFIQYIFSLITLVAGYICCFKLYERGQRTYSGIYYLFIAGGVTVFVFVFLILARARKNTELHRKRAIVSNCVTLAISAGLFLFILFGPVFSIMLCGYDYLFYLSLMLLASDVFNLAFQLKRMKLHKVAGDQQ